MTPFELASVMLPIAGVGGAWIKSIEKKVNQHEVIIAKLDQLITIMLEDRLEQ